MFSQFGLTASQWESPAKNVKIRMSNKSATQMKASNIFSASMSNESEHEKACVISHTREIEKRENFLLLWLHCHESYCSDNWLISSTIFIHLWDFWWQFLCKLFFCYFWYCLCLIVVVKTNQQLFKHLFYILLKSFVTIDKVNVCKLVT